MVAADAVHGTTIAASVGGGLRLGVPLFQRWQGSVQSTAMRVRHSKDGAGHRARARPCNDVHALAGIWPLGVAMGDKALRASGCTRVCGYKPHDGRTGRNGDQGRKVWA